jgi:hypothetical protein
MAVVSVISIVSRWVSEWSLLVKASSPESHCGSVAVGAETLSGSLILGVDRNKSMASSSTRWSMSLERPNCSAIGMNSLAEAIEPSRRFMRSRHS